MSTSVALLISGCGYLDGAEIREATLCYLTLSQLLKDSGGRIQWFAPDDSTHHVVDHKAGSPTQENRNMLIESARIARGDILPLSALDPQQFDALVIPGGFGVAKNFCSFAFDGPNCSVREDVQSTIKHFHMQKKPIGAVCIAPALVAKVLHESKPTVTIGNDAATAGAIESLGAIHQNTQTHAVCIDHKNLIYTTPAYMDDQANIVDVYEGIYACMKEVTSAIS